MEQCKKVRNIRLEESSFDYHLATTQEDFGGNLSKVAEIGEVN